VVLLVRPDGGPVRVKSLFVSFDAPGVRPTAASLERPSPPKHDPGDGYFMRRLGARFAAPHPGNIDADQAGMQDLLCDSGLD
jgi:hypothetical protein